MIVDTADTISNTTKNFIDIGERLVKLPTDERQYYRTVLSDTYRLLDNALLIPINRLSTILATSDRTVFVNELHRLEDIREWRKIERDVNLCEPLYTAGQEMEAATTRLKDKLSIRNRDQLRDIIQKLVDGEKGFALQIRSSLKSIADMASDAETSPESYAKVREAVRNKRDYLEDVRHELISAEIKNRSVLSPKGADNEHRDKKKPWYKRFSHKFNRLSL